VAWADPRRWSEGPRAAVAGAVVFLLTAAVPRGGLASSEGFGDHQLYRSFAERITNGDLPYRDFFVEYPPGALPVFVAPAAAGSHYPFAFKLLMALCGAAAVALLALTLVRLGVTGRRLWLGVAAAALVPTFFATVAINTYDLWPALLVMLAVWALVGGRERLSLAVLGLATAAKLVPAILLPLLLAHVWRTRGRTAARDAFVAFCAAAAVVTIPFVLIAPGGVWFSLKSQATRGLHSDSLGASLLFAADQLGLYDAKTAVQNPGSLNAIGSAADVVGVLASLATGAAALLVLWLYLRGPATAQRLATAAAATSAAPIALGKVLSPQFLAWLIPLVPLVPGALGVAAVAIFWAALAATIVFFLRYVTPFDLDAGVWLLVFRNLLLVALLAVLVAAVRAGARRAPRGEGSVAAPPS
jgi:uncharacterized membrane protein